MKKVIYGIFLLVAFSGNAQLTLTQAEYFWDNDPGEGLATALVAADGNFNAAAEAVLQSGVGFPAAVGSHIFNVRFKDSQNGWGTVFKNVINIEPTATTTSITLVQAEYFWDTDLGEGNGLPIVAFDGNFNAALESVFQSGVGFPTVTGNHVFNIRFKDSQNVWGNVFSNVIYIEPTATPSPMTLMQAEYFWDTDPGEGNATPIAAFDGNFNAAFETILQTGVGIAQPMGFHVFCIRAKDFQQVWGPALKNVIYIETTLGTDEFSQSELMAYPNPVKGVVYLKCAEELSEVTLFNLAGQQVLSQKPNAMQAAIDLSGLQAGSYLVKVNSAARFKTIKIIKE
ncbi:MAG: T9SS type A sorting domain-containing protein [Flavobacterium sp.]